MQQELTTSREAEILEECQKAIGYRFRQPELLRAALTHASGANTRLASNERLEFLGDAVLGLVTVEQLYLRFPDYQEGDLTKIKSVVVSRRTCARFSKELNLGEFLFLGKGMNDQHRPRAVEPAGRRLRVAGRGHLPRRRSGGGPDLHPAPARAGDRGGGRGRPRRQFQVAAAAGGPARVQRHAAVRLAGRERPRSQQVLQDRRPSSAGTPTPAPGAATRRKPSSAPP